MPSEGGLKQYPKKDNKVTISQRISDHRHCSSGEFHKFCLGYKNLTQINYPRSIKIYLCKDVYHRVAYITFAKTLPKHQHPNINK